MYELHTLNCERSLEIDEDIPPQASKYDRALGIGARDVLPLHLLLQINWIMNDERRFFHEFFGSSLVKSCGSRWWVYISEIQQLFNIQEQLEKCNIPKWVS